MSIPVQVAQIIRGAFGPEAEVVGIDLPGDWSVARVWVRGGAAPASLVAKWLRSNPAGWRTNPAQLATEAVALRFAGELTPGLVPRVLAAAPDHPAGGVILLEDLSPRQPLNALIRRDGAAATAGARQAFARAMGRLAASTASRDKEFRRRLGSHPTWNPEAELLGYPWEQLRRMLEGFGVRIPAAAETEADLLYRMFAEPGPFLALSNGDMGTNNFMIGAAGDDDGRLIDFEFAHFDHALARAANFYVPGPPWITLNDPIGDQLEREFRAELTRGIPEAADDQRYDKGIAAGCVAMGFVRCANLATMDGRPPGDPSRAQRLATAEAAATAAEARKQWPALCDVLRGLAHVLRHRWPDADVDFSSLHPYTPRS